MRAEVCFVIWLTCGCLAGCAERDEQPGRADTGQGETVTEPEAEAIPPNRPADRPSDESPPPVIDKRPMDDSPAPPYQGPEFRVTIEVSESIPLQYAAIIRTTTRTGGWELMLDRSEVVSGLLRVFLTLEAPSGDEIVTTALSPHSERIDTGASEIAAVEVYVKRTQRGSVSEDAKYALAARVPNGAN